jgi:predicted AlkP superfamily pyrophosphatase or phosphodiesterase
MSLARLALAVAVPLAVTALPTAGVESYALIVSVDGMRGDYYAQADRYGLKIPTLRGLMARGSHAEGVLGVFPSVTYPSHTTLITGCSVARHGILANGVFDPPNAPASGRWYWNYADIQVPTILDAARRAGWKTAAVGWPVTVGAPADYLFPEVWEPERFEDRLVAMSEHSRPRDLLAAVLTKFDLGPSVGDDQTLTRVARYMVETWKPRLMLLHLIEVDHQQHAHGPGSPECMAALEMNDACIGELLESYRKAGLLDRTLVAIVSDHGFLAIRRSFNVNVVLRRAGLIRFASQDDKRASEWDAAGWTAGGSCAILLRNADDKAVQEKVLASLAPFASGPDAPIRRILHHDEIAALGSNPRAFLMLDPADGFTFSARLAGEPIARFGEEGTTPGMHGQLPDRPGLEAALILAGPGVRPGVALKQARMIDVAPTLASALGLTMTNTDGRTIPELMPAASTRPATAR